MVIPRSPSPIPLEERDINGLSSEEMRELLQRQRVREMKLIQCEVADVMAGTRRGCQFR